MEPTCTGLTAVWCPRCGDCTCRRCPNGEPCLSDVGCALHATWSKHAETISLTECEDRIDALAGDLGVELTENDAREISRFAQWLMERSRKQKRDSQ